MLRRVEKRGGIPRPNGAVLPVKQHLMAGVMRRAVSERGCGVGASANANAAADAARTSGAAVERHRGGESLGILILESALLDALLQRRDERGRPSSAHRPAYQRLPVLHFPHRFRRSLLLLLTWMVLLLLLMLLMLF